MKHSYDEFSGEMCLLVMKNTVTMLQILKVLNRFLHAKYYLFIYFDFRVKVVCWGVISFQKIHPAYLY